MKNPKETGAGLVTKVLLEMVSNLTLNIEAVLIYHVKVGKQGLKKNDLRIDKRLELNFIS